MSNGERATLDQTRGVPKKASLEVRYNTCDNCYPSEVKCSGTEPCTLCTENGLYCFYMFRADEQMRQRILTLEHELATSRQQLLTHQQSSSRLQDDLLFYRSSLNTAQLDLWYYQHQAIYQKTSVDKIFNLLGAPHQIASAEFRNIALQSQDTAQFLQMISMLSDRVDSESNTSTAQGCLSRPATTTMPLVTTLSYPMCTAQSTVNNTSSRYLEASQNDVHRITSEQPETAQSQADNEVPTSMLSDCSLEMAGLQQFSLLPACYARSF